MNCAKINRMIEDLELGDLVLVAKFAAEQAAERVLRLSLAEASEKTEWGLRTFLNSDHEFSAYASVGQALRVERSDCLERARGDCMWAIGSFADAIGMKAGGISCMGTTIAWNGQKADQAEASALAEVETFIAAMRK